MATDVETGHGSIFELADENGDLTELAEVVNIPVPNGAADLINASHMKTVGFHDYIVSPLREGEEADLEMNWIPGSDTDALAAGARGETRDFRIELPVDGGTYEFEGSVLVRDYIRNNPMLDKRTGILRVKWVSEITETFTPTPTPTPTP